MKLFNKILLLIEVIASVILLYLLISMAILPNKYLMIVIALIIVCLVISFLLTYKANKVRDIIFKIISIIFSILLLFGCIQINNSASFIENISNSTTELHTISILVLKDSDYELVEDLNDKDLGYDHNIKEEYFDEFKSSLRGEYNLIKYDDYNSLVNDLLDYKIDGLIISDSDKLKIEDIDLDINNKTKVIYSYNIEEEVLNIKNEDSLDDGIFNICISGIDTYGDVSVKSRSDVNMLMSVNMNTNQILLTSIPRDYYVTLPSYDAKDKLTHAGIYGINETIGAISNLLDVDIDYYFRINFNSLINIVDIIGGIDVYSDTAFGSGDTYIKEGVNHMNGKMALAFSRERYSYKEGDIHRVQNQQAVIEAIIDKLSSYEIISNYNELLKELEGSFETNMTSKELYSLIKKQLNDLKKYEVIKQNLTGTGSMMTGGYSMPNSNLYYMIPDENSISDAKVLIDSVING